SRARLLARRASGWGGRVRRGGGAAGAAPGVSGPAAFPPPTPPRTIPAAGLAEAPQEQIDRRFYAIVTDLVGSPTELTDPDGTLAGHQQHTLWGHTAWRGR